VLFRSVATPVGGNTEILSSDYLTSADDVERIARLILDQFSGIKQQPTLEPSWPNVADMLTSIEELYEFVS